MEEISEHRIDKWETLMFTYESALKEIATKIDILNNEFIKIHNYNPIEHVTSRIKSSESIVKKLKRHGLEVNMDNMQNCLSDIAGIRIVCSFTSDIYRIADRISSQSDIQVLTVKNYIANPKPNGYKSYHMVVSVPVYLSTGPVNVKVEIQIRTIAMDFWASLEHKIRYKFEGKAPQHINEELKACSDIVNMLDAKMLQLNQAIIEARAAQEDGKEEYQGRNNLCRKYKPGGNERLCGYHRGKDGINTQFRNRRKYHFHPCR